MAASPKRRRLRATLVRRAEQEIGPGSTALDYAAFWIANGGLVSELARSLAQELSENVSREIVSLLLHRLAPDATARIAAARRIGADALMESALAILDGAGTSDAALRKAKHAAGIRIWLAERWRRSAPAPQAVLTLGLSTVGPTRPDVAA